ncbi:type II toxin-antitoxin system HicA family toxin [Breznakiellaceae bacterium SP9]
MDILQSNGWKLDRINGSHHVFAKMAQSDRLLFLYMEMGALGRAILKQAGIR